MAKLVIVMAMSLLAFAAPAQARRPVIAYVDHTTNKLAFYDAETATDLPAPDLTVPAPFYPFAVSFDGRYVFSASADKKLHLLDRATSTQVPLPGIDIYTGAADKPTGLTVSDTGLLAFDNNVNGPAVTYNSATGAFVPTGLAADNGHRQSHLSADGRFLATTCNSATKCAVDSGGHAQAYVQDLTTRLDTALPFAFGANVAAVDKEHPCVNAAGSLVAADVNVNPATVKHDVLLYNRTTAAGVPVPGLNSNLEEVNCVMSADGNYIGFDHQDAVLHVFERSTSTFLTLPSKVMNPAWFTVPYTPPATGGASSGGGTTSASTSTSTVATPPIGVPPAAVDTTAPTGTLRESRTYPLAAALAKGLVVTVTSGEDGVASGNAAVAATLGKRLGLAAASKAVVVARGSTAVTAGKPTKLRLRFTAKARRRLRNVGRIRLAVRVTVTDRAANTATLTAKTKLKR